MLQPFEGLHTVLRGLHFYIQHYVASFEQKVLSTDKYDEHYAFTQDAGASQVQQQRPSQPAAGFPLR